MTRQGHLSESRAGCASSPADARVEGLSRRFLVVPGSGGRLDRMSAQGSPQVGHESFAGDAGCVSGSDLVAALTLVETDPLPQPSGEGVDDVVVNAGLRALEALGEQLSAAGQSANTKRAYASGWRSFERFCTEHDLTSLPAHPRSVRWYVAWMAGQQRTPASDPAAPDAQAVATPRFKIATVRVHLAAIADAHARAGHLDPTRHAGVTQLVQGWARTFGSRPQRKEPVLLEGVLAIIASMEHGVYPAGVSAARDAAAIWLGFAGALRRSEAARLRLSSLRLHERDGIHVHVGSSKADQEDARADVVVLPYGSRASSTSCPVCAIHRWVYLVVGEQERAKLSVSLRRREVMRVLLSQPYRGDAHVCGRDGSNPLVSQQDLHSDAPLLRATYRNRHDARISDGGVSGDALHAMLRARAAAAGLVDTDLGFHSLRAGHVTQARRNGASTEAIMRAGRWRRAATVDVYDREFDPATRNSVTSLGL